jgi:protein gp37
MAVTDIEWTDETWKLTTGCQFDGPECDNCYALQLTASRLRHHPMYQGLAQMRHARPVWTGEVRLHPDKLDEPRHWRRPRRVFVANMSDLFHPAVPVNFLVRAFEVMGEVDRHTYQILTKRSARMAELLRGPLAFAALLPHIWWGVSCGDRAHGLKRLADLRTIHTAGPRWVSCEPLLEDLGPVDFTGLAWVVIGGESDQHKQARPCAVEWIRALFASARQAGAAIFVKQLGAHATLGGQRLDLHASKGNKPEEWPPDLRIREYPDPEDLR